MACNRKAVCPEYPTTFVTGKEGQPLSWFKEFACGLNEILVYL